MPEIYTKGNRAYLFISLEREISHTFTLSMYHFTLLLSISTAILSHYLAPKHPNFIHFSFFPTLHTISFLTSKKTMPSCSSILRISLSFLVISPKTILLGKSFEKEALLTFCKAINVELYLSIGCWGMNYRRWPILLPKTLVIWSFYSLNFIELRCSGISTLIFFIGLKN